MKNQIIDAVAISIFLAAVMFSWGCNAYSREMVGFWDQRVAFTAWGFTMATEFGPFNIGYLQWNRNVEPLKPASPADVIPLTGPLR